MSFKCEICLTEFKQKIGLQKHLNKKNKCNIITDFKCKKCNKYFKYNKNLLDHTNKNTCIKKIIEENLNDSVNNDEQRKINAIRAIINSESLNIDSKINLLQKYNLSISLDQIKMIITSDFNINDMIDTLLSFTNKLTETTINNINNGTVNNNNIQINNFGSENEEYLDNEYFIKLLSKNNFEKAYLKLTKDIYLRVDHPENRTIKIENLNNKFAYKYENGKWKGILKSELKDLLHNKNKKLIKVHLESLKDVLDEKVPQEMNTYLKRNINTDPFMKDLNERNILLLYTGKVKNEI